MFTSRDLQDDSSLQGRRSAKDCNISCFEIIKDIRRSCKRARKRKQHGVKLDIGKIVAEGVACLLCHVELCDVRRPSLEKKVVVSLNPVGELSRLRGPPISHRLVVVLMSHRETERMTDPDCHGEIQELIVRVVISTQLVDKFGKEFFIGINGDAMSVTKNSHFVEALVR